MPFTYEYERPMVCADVIVLNKQKHQTSILLIQRKNDPYKDSWALPGGFIEMNEDLIDSAYRELKEETSVSKILLRQFKAYGKPGRDPRGRTISVVFYGETENKNEAKAGDDAKCLDWFDLKNLPELAFDHTKIIDEFLSKHI